MAYENRLSTRQAMGIAQQKVDDRRRSRRRSPNVELLEDNIDKVKRAIEAGILRRGGQLKRGMDRYRGIDPFGGSITEAARLLMRSFSLDPGAATNDQLIERAISTSDLDEVMSTVQNVSLVNGYENANVTFPSWTGSLDLPDFKSADFLNCCAPTVPVAVGELEPVIQGVVHDTKVSTGLSTYAVEMRISRTAIINDSAQVLSKTPAAVGKSFAKLINAQCVAALTSTTVQSDGFAFFHASHPSGNNIVSSGAGAPSAAQIGLMTDLLRNQLDLGAVSKLGTPPARLLGPPSLEGAIRDTIHELELSDASDEYLGNIKGAVDVDLTGTAYFLFGDPATAPAISVAYLDGARAPHLTKVATISPLYTTHHAVMDFAVVQAEWRHAVKNNGA